MTSKTAVSAKPANPLLAGWHIEPRHGSYRSNPRNAQCPKGYKIVALVTVKTAFANGPQNGHKPQAKLIQVPARTPVPALGATIEIAHATKVVGGQWWATMKVVTSEQAATVQAAYANGNSTANVWDLVRDARPARKPAKPASKPASPQADAKPAGPPTGAAKPATAGVPSPANPALLAGLTKP
jgi:hypothetical protein